MYFCYSLKNLERNTIEAKREQFMEDKEYQKTLQHLQA